MIAALLALLAQSAPDAVASPTTTPPGAGLLAPAPPLAHPPPPAWMPLPDVARVTAPPPGEPSLADLRAAASALAGADPERVRSMLSRARKAAWLPELRVRYDRRFGRGEAVDLGGTTAAPPPLQLDTANDVRYEIRATWDLGRLVFSPEELRAHAEALRTADVRREIEAAVTRIYFERRRLRAERVLAPAGDPASAARRDLRIAEIESELDALTGGRWSEAAAVRP